jgi:hypothetical protein
MIKKTVWLLLLSTIAFCQFEVIPILDGLSEKTRDRLWPGSKGGAININDTDITIADQSSLFLQNRQAPYEHTTIDLRHDSNEYLYVFKVVVSKDWFAYLALGGDRNISLFKRKRKTGEVYGPQVRQGGGLERLFLLDNNHLVATGAYRPALVGFLERYMKGSVEEQLKNVKEKYDPLYLNHKAYTISVYDENLKEIDSGNVIDRVGDNARAYEGLNLSLAVDLAENDNIYLIDNDQGYVVEKYINLTELESSFEIKNRWFKKLPKDLSMKDMYDLRGRDRAYSVPYALFEKEGLLVTSFFQAPVYYEQIEPPYYYDVSTTTGQLLNSGMIEYPLICEDDGGKIFFYVKQEGGWFEEDRHFLVGVTTADLVRGVVSRESIDKCIEQYQTHE